MCLCRECSELRYNYSFLKAEHGNVMVGGHSYCNYEIFLDTDNSSDSTARVAGQAPDRGGCLIMCVCDTDKVLLFL